METIKWILLILFFFTSNLHSQLIQNWASTYNGPLDSSTDVSYSIAVDNQGNSFVTGGSSSLTGLDLCTIKYNSSGVRQWVARYSRTNSTNDYALCVKLDRNKNVYVTGSSILGIVYSTCTIKYDSNGTQKWADSYTPQDGSAETFDIIIDEFENVYVTGTSYKQDSTFCITIKYNPMGNMQWIKTYPGKGKSIKMDIFGNIIVGCSSNELNNSSDICIIKYDTSGTRQWISKYNYSLNNSDEITSIIIDNLGNIYASGVCKIYPDSGFITTLKYNNSGTQQWVKSEPFGSLVNEFASTVALDKYLNVFTLMARSYMSGYIRLVKYNSNGTKLGANNYPNNGIDINQLTRIPLFLDSNSNIFTAIYMNDGQSHSCILKYTDTCSLEWIKRIDEPVQGYSKVYSMGLNETGSIWISGILWNTTNYGDCWTVRFDQLIGINPISSNVTKSFNLQHNYPNPFNPSTRIKFDLAAGNKNYIKEVKLIVFDIQGREILKLVNESLKPGTYEAEWNASNYPSGIYFARLTAGEYTKTIKMILLK